MKIQANTILPKLPAVGKRRLRKLIAFLRQLPRDKFDFNSTVPKVDSEGCGTVCCAIGWTPAVFPTLCKWRGIQYRALGEEHYSRAGARLFGMDALQALHLFCPHGQKLVHRRLPSIAFNATPKQVAAMLSKYIELTETPQP